VVLHSGSRGIGNQLAMTHIAKAQGLMKQWFISLPDPDLAYLPQGTPEFDAYIADLLWCQAYARDNRDQMLSVVLDAVEQVTRTGIESSRVSCHHNFTQLEHHRNRDLWRAARGTTRRRATSSTSTPWRTRALTR